MGAIIVDNVLGMIGQFALASVSPINETVVSWCAGGALICTLFLFLDMVGEVIAQR
jgi:hypothetical protein